MRGTYYIGKSPRIGIPVVVAGNKLIAVGFAEVADPAVFWLKKVAPGHVVDSLGACSFPCGGIDLRAADGGATFVEAAQPASEPENDNE